MKRKLVFFIPLLFLLFTSVSLCYGAWWMQSSNLPQGQWDVLEWTHIKENQHDREGLNMWYVCDDSGINFTGFHMKLNVTQFDAWRKEWWQLRAEKNIEIGLFFRNATNTDFGVNVVINFKRCAESWGYFQDYWVFAGSNINSTDVWVAERNQDKLELYPFSYIEVFIWRNGTNFCIKVLNYRSEPNPILLYAKNYSLPDSWFKDVIIELWVRHWGAGSFDAGWSEPEVYNNEPYNPSIPQTQGIPGYSIWDFINDLAGIITNNLPSWFRGWITSLGSWFDFLIGILAIIFDIAAMSLQYLPLIILFWFLDAVITSVYDGNLHPLGNCFMTIFNFIRGLIGVLVNIIQTIYDFIHFW